jgi:hypothetical protein
MSVAMKPGRDAVDGDVAAAQFARQRARHAGHAGLGGRVVGLAGLPLAPTTEVMLTMRP